jgi:hypothetical protein
MAKFLKTVTGLHDQPLQPHQLQPGSWVRTGTNGVEEQRGVLMGAVQGRPVRVQDVGQSRVIFREQMRIERAFVIKANALLN